MAKELVDASRIDQAAMEAGASGSQTRTADPLTRDPIIDQKMGWLGKLFGYGEEKKGNLAVLAFLISSLLMTVCLGTQIWASSENALQVTSGMITPLFGVMTGIIGYITGQKGEG